MRHLSWQEIQLPGSVFHLSLTAYKPNERFPLHDHDFAELTLIGSGQGWQILNGQKLELVPGCLWMLRPADQHLLVAGPLGLEVLNCAFPLDLALELEDRYFPGENGYFRATDPQPCSQVLRGETLLRAINLFHENVGKSRTLFELHHLLLDFYSLLRSPYSDSLIMGAPDWLRQACLEVRKPENLAQGLPRFFALAGRSPEHVSREMKRLTGKTPTEFVNELRLDRASQLLCTTALGTLDVALDCGFDNLSWFHRLFKDRFGVTPLQYRKRGAAAVLG